MHQSFVSPANWPCPSQQEANDAATLFLGVGGMEEGRRNMSQDAT